MSDYPVWDQYVKEHPLPLPKEPPPSPPSNNRWKVKLGVALMFACYAFNARHGHFMILP